MFIAGDVGGTNVRLAYYSEQKGLYCVHASRYSSRDFPNFPSLLQQFLEDISHPPIYSATFGIAGPVRDRMCKATNLPWIVSAEELEGVLKTRRVFLINDLEANAWGLRCLRPNEFFILNVGEENRGNQALLSAGTGLGEAGLYFDGKEHQPFACEGGHCDFSPKNEEEIALFHFLSQRFEHVSFERILSGNGLYQLYCFLIETKRMVEDPKIASLLSQSEQPQKIITEKALLQECPICMRVCQIFATIYGAEAGNLALKFLAVGGVFVGGGLAPKLLPFLHEEGRFFKAFTAKGRFSPLLSKIPVRVVLNDQTALLGAARYCQEKGIGP